MSTATDDRLRPATVNINLGDHRPRAAVLAEETVPGLWITPDFAGADLTGDWKITHGPSGYALPLGVRMHSVDLDTARRIAAELGKTGIDWTVDIDELKAAFADDATRQLVSAAVQAGKFPPPEADPEGTDQPDASRWPNTEAQATGEQLAAAYAVRGLGSWRQFLSMAGTLPADPEENPDRVQLYAATMAAAAAEYAVVALLRRLQKVSPDEATSAAREIWHAVGGDGSVGEWLAVWGREYGIDPSTIA